MSSLVVGTVEAPSGETSGAITTAGRSAPRHARRPANPTTTTFITETDDQPHHHEPPLFEVQSMHNISLEDSRGTRLGQQDVVADPRTTSSPSPERPGTP
jgi:hypothetical protein